MLVVRQSLGIESAGLSFDWAIGKRAGLYFVRLHGVTWDTRFIPRAARDRGAWSLIAMLMRGTASIDGVTVVPGGGMVMAEGHLFPSTPESTVVRATGSTVEAVALRVRTSALALDAREPVPRQFGDELCKELAGFAERMRGGDPVAGLEERLSAAVAACTREGLLSALDEEPDEGVRPDVRRAAEALYPLLGDLSRNPMLIDLVQGARVTPRQMLRDILRLQSEYDFLDRGWREVLARWRVMMAVLLLSAEDMTPTRVAAEVGYGSLTAMGRAFRDQGLPPPREVRKRVRC